MIAQQKGPQRVTSKAIEQWSGYLQDLQGSTRGTQAKDTSLNPRAGGALPADHPNDRRGERRRKRAPARFLRRRWPGTVSP